LLLFSIAFISYSQTLTQDNLSKRRQRLEGSTPRSRPKLQQQCKFN